MDIGDWLALPSAGSYADWVAAVGTVGTLAAGIAVLKGEGRERADRARFEQSVQARGIRLSSVSVTSKGGNQGTYCQWDFEVTVTNDSTDPIHGVAVGLFCDSAQVLDGYPPSKVLQVTVLPQSEHRTVSLRTRTAWPRGLGDTYPDLHVTPGLSFTDSAGQHWTRRADYRLQRAEIAGRRRFIIFGRRRAIADADVQRSLSQAMRPR